LSAYAGWFAAEWVVALAASAFFLATSAVILWFAFRPPIEIGPGSALKASRNAL
jgi:hypothetical protein